jgi:hypothetical protein
MKRSRREEKQGEAAYNTTPIIALDDKANLSAAPVLAKKSASGDAPGSVKMTSLCGKG